MSLNVTETALDVTGFCKIYYNQQEKDKGPWSKAIGPFLMGMIKVCREDHRRRASIQAAQGLCRTAKNTVRNTEGNARENGRMLNAEVTTDVGRKPGSFS